MSSFPSKAFYIAAILGLNLGPAVASGSDSAQAISSDQLASELVTDADDPWLRPGLVTEWAGDFDGIIDRGFLRLLTVPNKTHYFVDGARERGTTAETALALEKMINAKLPRKEHITVVTIPVQRDQLITMLIQGLGDIAIGSLTITPERKKFIDFSVPIAKNIREVVVTTAETNPITTLEDLSGREIWVRQSSSYHETLTTLSRKFESEGRPRIDIRLTSETLEDEDLLEMVNAGLYPATVVDSHKIEIIWKDVFDQLTISSVVISDNGEIGAAIRKDSPLLKEMVDEFYREHRVGTAFGNILVKFLGGICPEFPPPVPFRLSVFIGCQNRHGCFKIKTCTFCFSKTMPAKAGSSLINVFVPEQMLTGLYVVQVVILSQISKQGNNIGPGFGTVGAEPGLAIRASIDLFLLPVRMFPDYRFGYGKMRYLCSHCQTPGPTGINHQLKPVCFPNPIHF